jgi:uncharacterized repeat protein (TIGR01451 family)
MPVKAQWVTIPDTNFVNKLTQLYPSCMNGNLMDTTCTQIIIEDSINVISAGIINLEGIQYFNNLQYLNCAGNQISTLLSIPASLIEFNCFGNYLSLLPALPLTLIKLNCSFNQLTNLPNLPGTLQVLICDINNLTSLPPIPSSLKTLSCSANYTLANLPQLPSTLTFLDYGETFISVPTQLPDSLQYLDCSHNQMTNLPNLPSSLMYLYCDHNQLTQLPTIPSTLQTLDCGENSIIELPTIPSTLTSLYAADNQLSWVPLVPDTMGGFQVHNNNIYCFGNLPYVNIGNISNNPVTCVPNQTFYSMGLPFCLDNDPIYNSNNCVSTVNINGKIYTDLNANCNFETSDLNISNIPVLLFDSSNNLVAQNNAINGVYGFSINQTGTYTIKLPVNSSIPFSIACTQADSQIVNLISISNTISNINFPVECSINNAYDAHSQSIITQSLVFPGQTHIIKTNISNNQTWYNLDCDSSTYYGTVSINITGPVTYVAPANNALTPTVNGNSFTYNITDFSTLTPASFGLKFLTDTTAQANDQICVHVEINPTPIDADTTNNVYDFCYNVSNSYDPNMKEVYPVNVLPGYDDWFTYTIHFQNTGNAPAFNIRLRDTLDANLDINSFEMLGYSHPAIVSINGNVLTVRFNNIMLPDSTTDYEGSIGYFQYRLKPLSNLPLGTQIENTAYIYFDYNAPIVTNTTQNNFQTVLYTLKSNTDAKQLSVFPNPANEKLTIKLQNSAIENCIITNALGQTVYNSANEMNAHPQLQLNISNLKAGVYFVKVRSSNGSYTAKFIKSE